MKFSFQFYPNLNTKHQVNHVLGEFKWKYLFGNVSAVKKQQKLHLSRHEMQYNPPKINHTLSINNGDSTNRF